MYLRPEPDLGWFPTHVQVTILQARGLRAKGKQGTSDAYTLISIGREKYSTSVVEKTPGSPEWKEECSFELSPGALERGENCDLQLTVMHRALIGMDQFLGQVLIPLQQVYQEGRSQRNQWYKLRSKPGKKEKERGEIQVSIQFTRNSLTASMMDLSKGKSKTPFGKLKDKMKGKKHLNMESSSAIVPSSIGRLDSDDEDEKKPKSKATAFFKGLRKSSLTRSNTSLGSDSTISSTSGTVPISASFSASGTVPSISIVVPEEVKKPAARNSSLSSEPSGVAIEASPRMTHKRAFSDEVSQVNMFPEPKAVQNLKPKSSPISKSSVCINGSHVYTEVPLPKPSPSLEKSTPASRSFQNILKKAEETTVPEVLTRQVYTTEKQEHKSATPPVAAPEEKTSSKSTAPKLIADQAKVEIKPVQVTSPMVFAEDVSKNKGLEVKARDEKGRESPQPGYIKDEMVSKGLEDPRPRVPSGSEDRSKVGAWFGSKNSKDTPQKPSFLSGSVATSEAAERSSALVEERSPAEDQKNPSLYQKGTRLGEALNDHHHYMDSSSGSAETVSDHHYIDSSPASPETVSEWEEQFDAFASSRLQKSPETKENDLFSDFEKNPSQSMFGVPVSGVPSVRQSYSEDSHFVRPWTQVPSNLWANTAEYSRERTEEPSFPESHSANFPTSCIPNSESAVAWTLPKNMAANEFTSCITMQNQLEQHPCVETLIPKPSPIKIKYVEANHTEIGVASVSPLSKGHMSVSLGGTSYSSVSKNISPFQKNDPSAVTSIAESSHEPIGNTDIVVEEVRASVEPTKQALIGHNFVRVGEDLSPSPVNERTPVEERVTELITEQGIVENIDLAPTKPPRLKLSHAVEFTELDVDNYKQTSLQEANRKQTGSPEEHEPEQNMGIGKQIVSPVTCCPVIEISPALGSTTEDTQSTTEGPLTNLGDNDECKKLGTTNGEHLFEVNETSAVEQFRTCPSNVSLDLSSLQESSNKLEVISPAEPHSTGGGKDLEEFVFQKPMPMPKKQKHNSTDGSNASKRYDHSGVLFWSALEDQVPCSLATAGHDQQNVGVQLESKEFSSQSLECRADPEHHKSEDLKSQLVVSHSPPPNEVPSSKPQSNVKVFHEEESQRSTLLSQESLWSADIVVDFKNEDFWRTDSHQVSQNTGNLPSPGNPFTPTNQAPLSPKNPFVDHPRESQSSEDLSFKHLNDQAAVRDFPSAGPTVDAKAPRMHGNQPLAFSTPSFAITPNPKPSNFPSPIQFSSASGVTTTTNTLTATLSCFRSPAASGATSPAPAVLPQETQPSENPFMPLKNSFRRVSY
ncbi:serine-rich adhesin for platelets-like isoform X2 [Hyperolius riggenbachi]|uniref:serine-rich adhesin for platelets-like isoform X2 n=1 Tax=Hyperolius riggenbachi TaxID=752182 RepID=UPI0035A37ECD